MQMDAVDCLMRLESASFGVLGTLDADRGTHLVPVVFAVRGDELVIPIDAVKPKTTTRLRRIDNLRADARASLLVDHRDADWGALWWVQADLEFIGAAELASRWRSALAGKYPQYRPAETIESLLVFTIRSTRGWTAA
ncbi:MAG: pyridoxamine 5'-phosphate oxidase family protein [Actinomycetota bacterium]|nr:pyridoxamine 5'-phosphate oxidase family protein [Actinomycetota bacterium]